EVLGSVADCGSHCLFRRHVAVGAAASAATDQRCGRVLYPACVGGVPGRGRGVDAGATGSERIQHDVPLRVFDWPRRDRYAVPGRRQHDCAPGAVRHPGGAPDRDELTVSLLIGPTTAVTRPYVALPESQLLAGDLQILSASVSAATTGSARSATLYFRTPTDRTLTLGAPLIPPTFSTVATAP